MRTLGYDSQVLYYLVLFYFMLLMILGNIMLFSLFTAILLENFEGDMAEQIEQAKEKALAASNPENQEMKKSVTQRLVDKEAWAAFYEGFKDAFGQNHKRRSRDEGEQDEGEGALGNSPAPFGRADEDDDEFIDD